MKRAVFTQSDVTRAFRAAAKAGVHAAVTILPNGTIQIIPADRFASVDASHDLDARLDSFGAS